MRIVVPFYLTQLIMLRNVLIYIMTGTTSGFQVAIMTKSLLGKIG